MLKMMSQNNQDLLTVDRVPDVFGSTYNLQWLFDPDRVDHLPIEEQLKLFKQRDLRKTKVFKLASKIWGGPLSRKRVCIAPPMYTINGQEGRHITLHPHVTTTDLKPQKPAPILPSKEDTQEQVEKDKVLSYKKWIEERKTFRKDMDSMGLTEEYLTRKTNKTSLENRVLQRMLKEKYPKAPTPPPREETPPMAVLPEELPLVQRPSPMAINIIEQFLHEKKMRLIDLFTRVDKDKNWKVSREEFRQAIKEAKIPISEVLLEDLILTLDTDLSDELDYRELAKGMGLWKIEKREAKRKALSTASFSSSPSKFSQMSGFESPEKLEALESQFKRTDSAKRKAESVISNDSGCAKASVKREKSDLVKEQTSSEIETLVKEKSKPEMHVVNDDEAKKTRERTSSQTRIKSALSTISSTSSKHLEPPDLDLRPEIRVYNSEEAMVDLRKRDREALAWLQVNTKSTTQKKKVMYEPLATDNKTFVKTGIKAIDDHMTSSTLGSGPDEQVERFRQLRLMEYYEICKLCKERNISLSENLLQKVLLYPPDRSHREIQKTVRPRPNTLIPIDFAIPKVDKSQVATPSPEIQESNKPITKVKVSKEGKVQVFVDSRQAYPSKSKVAVTPIKMNLSTGKAIIRRQVNCWLTYEEYEKLTRKYATRYIDLHGSTDDNAFWPGHLLDKIAIYMPEPPALKSSVFHSTRQNKRTNPGYNNDLRTFPISDKGYVQYATIDK